MVTQILLLAALEAQSKQEKGKSISQNVVRDKVQSDYSIYNEGSINAISGALSWLVSRKNQSS